MAGQTSTERAGRKRVHAPDPMPDYSAGFMSSPAQSM